MTNQTPTPVEAPADRNTPAPADTIGLEALITDLAERYVTDYLSVEPGAMNRAVLGRLHAYAKMAAHWSGLPLQFVDHVLEGGPRRPTIEDVPAMVARLMRLSGAGDVAAMVAELKRHAGKDEPAELPAPTHIRIPLDIDLLSQWVTDDDEDDELLLVALTEWIEGLSEAHLNTLGDATNADPAQRQALVRAALTEIARGQS